MKKLLFLALSLLLVSSFRAQTVEKNILKVNPLSALLGTGSVFYENKIDDKQSWQLGLAYMGLNLDQVHYTGIAITPEYRIYIRKKALTGVYVGPYLRYQSYTLSSGGNRGNYSSFGGGVVFGHQWLYRSGFVLDMFAGPALNSGRIKITSGSSDAIEPSFGINGFGLRVGMALGFGF